MIRLRLSAVYGALFLVFGVQLPYLPVWLDWKGFGANEIAFLLAAPMVARIIVMPALGMWADAMGDVGRVARVLAAGAFACALAMAAGIGDGLLLLQAMFVVGLMLCAPSLNPLTETMTIAAVRAGLVDYGKVRLWGSLTFIIANLAAGYAIDRMGAASVGWLIAAGAGLTVLALLGLQGGETSRTTSPDLKLARPRLDSLVFLLKHRTFLVLLVGTGLLQASHAVFYVYGVLHWQSLGYSTTVIGALWAIGVVAEICLFQVARRVISVTGAIGLIALGGVGGAVRWGAMAFDPWLGVLVGLQLLHALTFAAAHTGAMHLLGKLVPPEMAGSAQALYATFTASIAMSCAMLLAGVLYPLLGSQSYLAMAAISVVGLGTVLMLRREVSAGDNL